MGREEEEITGLRVEEWEWGLHFSVTTTCISLASHTAQIQQPWGRRG
jgi:hypothetical protein